MKYQPRRRASVGLPRVELASSLILAPIAVSLAGGIRARGPHRGVAVNRRAI